MTTAQDGGKIVSLMHRPPLPQKILRKGFPLQAWSGPEGSKKLRFPDYMTTAQDGGKIVRL